MEVTSMSLVYLVDLPQIDQEQEKWPDQEMMGAVARELDAEIRAEELASSQRKFWARDLLLGSLWHRLKERKMMLPFLKKMIIEKLNQVTLCREIMFSVIDKVVVESIERQERLARRQYATNKREASLKKIVTRRSKKTLEAEKERKKDEQDS